MRTRHMNLLFIIAMLLGVMNCYAGWQGAADWFYRLPQGDLWENGYGMEANLGFGTERVSLVLSACIPLSSDQDEEALLARIRPLVPSEPRIEYEIPQSPASIGPSLFLSESIADKLKIRAEVGIRWAYVHGPWVTYRKSMPTPGGSIELDYGDWVKYDIGVLARVAADLEVGPFGSHDTDAFTVGVAYDTEINDPRAKYAGVDIGEVGFEALLLRIGFRHVF